MRTRSKLSILLSILLCCTMLAGLLPTVAFAEDSTTVSSENGADTSSRHVLGEQCRHDLGERCRHVLGERHRRARGRALGRAFRCMDWGNRIPDIGGGGKCRYKR